MYIHLKPFILSTECFTTCHRLFSNILWIFRGHSPECLATFPLFPAFPAFRSPFLYSWFYTQPVNNSRILTTNNAKFWMYYFYINLKICRILRPHVEIIRWRFHIKIPSTFWDMRTWDMWKVCLQTLRNNTIC